MSGTPLADRIVLVTGASSGIGEAVARQLAAMGAHLILTARRLNRLQALAEELEAAHGVRVLPCELDVRDREAVLACVAHLPADWRAIYALVNNAGLALTTDKMQDADPANWDTMIDTNVKGLLYMTHACLPTMLANNAGHIVNIGSVAGHSHYPSGNVYSATKHAVRAISHSLRIDLLGRPIRVTEIDPGAVETEFSVVRWQDKDKADAFYADFTPLVAGDIADAVCYALTRPPHVTIAEMLIFPTDQASANHLHRRHADSPKGMLDR